ISYSINGLVHSTLYLSVVSQRMHRNIFIVAPAQQSGVCFLGKACASRTNRGALHTKRDSRESQIESENCSDSSTGASKFPSSQNEKNWSLPVVLETCGWK